MRLTTKSIYCPFNFDFAIMIRNLYISRFLFLVPLFLSFFAYSLQPTSKVDSLLSLLKTDKTDTNKVIHSYKLCREYINIGLYDTALNYGNAALHLAQQLNFKKGIANSYNNIGIVYRNQGDYPKALDCYFKALKMDEEENNKNEISKRLCNIGIVYWTQGDYPKALDYYLKALKLDKELKNKNGIARNLSNIGIVYMEQADYPKALDYYFKALKMAEELDNKQLQINTLGNIGNIFSGQVDYPKALDFYFKALNMVEKIGDKNGIATWLGNIGFLYIKTGKFKEAELCLKRAIAIDDSIGALNFLRIYEGRLSYLYDTTAQLAMGVKHYATAAENYKLSLLHYKKAMVLKDTLFSQENKKQLVRKEMNYEFAKKEATSKAEHDKQIAIEEAEKKRQRIIIWSILMFAIIVFLLFFYRNKFKQKAMIEKEINLQQKLRFKAVIDAEEKERRRIAQDLHDGIGQTLAAMKMNISSKTKFVSEENQKILQQIIVSIDSAHKEVRTLSHSMMPKALNESGLEDAIDDLLEKILANSTIKCIFEKDSAIRFDENTEIGLYRVFQELINNILKHANASEIAVHLHKTKTQIILMVEDNGVGIKQKQLGEKKGMGLSNIETRVHALNGTFSISAGTHQGTIAVVRIPTNNNQSITIV